MSVTGKFLVIGQCVLSNLKNAVKVRVTTQELDENLLMYFPKRWTIYAYDKQNQVKPGDVVLIKELSKQLTKEITHEVLEVVYPIGNITDPITGKKVVVSQFEEDMMQRDKLLGSQIGGFTKYKELNNNQKTEKSRRHTLSTTKFRLRSRNPPLRQAEQLDANNIEVRDLWDQNCQLIENPEEREWFRRYNYYIENK